MGNSQHPAVPPVSELGVKEPFGVRSERSSSREPSPSKNSAAAAAARAAASAATSVYATLPDVDERGEAQEVRLPSVEREEKKQPPHPSSISLSSSRSPSLSSLTSPLTETEDGSEHLSDIPLSAELSVSSEEEFLDSAHFRLQALVERFSPIVLLHKSEEFFPSTVEYYLANSELWYGNTRLARRGEVTEEVLIDTEWIEKQKREAGGGSELKETPLRLKLSPDCRSGFGREETNRAPIYSYVREGHKLYWEIVYNFFYCHHTPLRLFGCCAPEGRDGNWEHICLRISKRNYKLIAAYYGGHNQEDGVWYLPHQLEFKGEKPLVYVARGTHACYPSNATWWKTCCLTNDLTSSAEDAIEWAPKNVIIYDPSDDRCKQAAGIRWLQYKDIWSDHPRSPKRGLPYLHWWEQDPEISNSCFRRLCCSFWPRWLCCFDPTKVCQKTHKITDLQEPRTEPKKTTNKFKSRKR